MIKAPDAFVADRAMLAVLLDVREADGAVLELALVLGTYEVRKLVSAGGVRDCAFESQSHCAEQDERV